MKTKAEILNFILRTADEHFPDWQKELVYRAMEEYATQHTAEVGDAETVKLTHDQINVIVDELIKTEQLFGENRYKDEWIKACDNVTGILYNTLKLLDLPTDCPKSFGQLDGMSGQYLGKQVFDYGDTDLNERAEEQITAAWTDGFLTAKLQKTKGQEYILCAAIRKRDSIDAAGNPMMHCGWRHANILWQNKNVSRSPNDQGFLTSKGRWVSRIDAMHIAKAAGQLDPEYKDHLMGLFSEDLY